MNSDWIKNAFIYHIYPLGLCAAPKENDFQTPPEHRLNCLYEWIPHIKSLGANAIYFGPLFESSSHGYDTKDYFQVDRRLGTNDTFKELVKELKQHGIRIILDGVFNHVGRDFGAFQDVLINGKQSQYVDWFININFEESSPYGDKFSYEGWAGHYDLVKLNLHNQAVCQYLFEAISFWVDTFDIDGLRLDAADAISFDFFPPLKAHCRNLKSDFWLMGEVVHGDYYHWANDEMLDSTTNYEAYKGLYSSHLDCNLFEIAYSLNRQFSEDGIYKDLTLYNFVDNHDVNRLASNLKNSAHLYTIYGLLFTMPGIPSLYYGSEWGIAGKRTDQSDHMLRPTLSLDKVDAPEPDLITAIRRFAELRSQLKSLEYGSYKQLYIAHEQFAFERVYETQHVIVLINTASEPGTIDLHNVQANYLIDRLNNNEVFEQVDQGFQIDIPCNWLRVLEVQ